MTDREYYVVLFDSVQHAMKAEKILKNSSVSFKLIPVPKHISANCGICLRFLYDSIEDVKTSLSDPSDYSEIRKM